jgi:predicted GNAT superfamily acetyltransferase
VTILEMRSEDLDAVAAINAANIGDVDPVGHDELALIVESCRFALVAEAPDVGVVGFAITIDAECRHLSERARWALATGDADLHLERVAFDMDYSGLGLGLALYNELDDRVLASGRDVGAESITLTSMVRVDPPNRHSVDFHAARGFETVGQAQFDDALVALVRRTYVT